MRRAYQGEADFWSIRNFLREVFLLNGCREHSWHVARLDYWRWHLILTCQVCDSVDRVTSVWETPDGRIAAVLHPVGWGEICLHVHPRFRTAELDDEMLRQAEELLAERTEDGRRRLVVPTFADDRRRQQVLARRGFVKTAGRANHWQRDLDAPVPLAPAAPGYTIRSMGDSGEHAARSWASWRAFHSDEPDEACDRDGSWYRNLQAAPLYRRDLDIVAAAPNGDIAAFSTFFYDDFTRSAVSVLVGTAAEHWRRGLGKAVYTEGLRRLQSMGCTRVLANGHDAPANALYRSVLGTSEVTETWVKQG
jgi:ribosomal protein S18 acetylase RimI-like enzyme